MSHTRIKGGVCAPKGFRANAVCASIKNPDSERLDLALLVSEQPCASAGTFTTNRIKAAPVKVTHAHLRDNDIRAVVVNSGNANACTGVKGLTDARKMVQNVSKRLGLKRREVGICSTGVIGLPMPMERISPNIEPLINGLTRDQCEGFAEAILTSDTRIKQMAVRTKIGGTNVRIGACAKGAGMICPNMATMLCFVTTDANIGRNALRNILAETVENTFNRITIDGDMSTNDTVLLLANGASGGERIRNRSPEMEEFQASLEYVLLNLAQELVKDGERVSKFVTLHVHGARTRRDAQKVAFAVAKSALVKASWNGNDPNWGRIIHAVGYAQASIREELIDIYYNNKTACTGGVQSKTEPETLRKIVTKPSFSITIDLNLGEAEYTVYSSDISPEYIDFNRSEYAYWTQNKPSKKP